jgi:hypothetical protein
MVKLKKRFWFNILSAVVWNTSVTEMSTKWHEVNMRLNISFYDNYIIIIIIIIGYILEISQLRQIMYYYWSKISRWNDYL